MEKTVDSLKYFSIGGLAVGGGVVYIICDYVNNMSGSHLASKDYCYHTLLLSYL